MSKKISHIIKEVSKVLFSGFGGVILTLCCQSKSANLPPSFTFIYNGNEVLVTETTYAELIKQNNALEDENLQLRTELTEMKIEHDSNKSKEKVTQVIRDATEYWNNAEYTQALTLLKNSAGETEDIGSLYKSYSEKYCLIVLEETEELLLKREYAQAKERLTNARGLVVDGTVLENKLLDINNLLPVKLSSFKVSTTRYFELSENKRVEDSVGNKYSTGNLFTIQAEGKERYGYATFYLGKKYTSLSGTIAVSDESENRSDIQLEGWVEIYSIKEEEYNHIYTSPILSRMTSPIDVSETSLYDADWLEIRYYNNGEYYSMAGGYHSLEVILSNFKLYND